MLHLGHPSLLTDLTLMFFLNMGLILCDLPDPNLTLYGTAGPGSDPL